VNERFIALAMMTERMNPAEPSSAPAMISSLLLSTTPKTSGSPSSPGTARPAWDAPFEHRQHAIGQQASTDRVAGTATGDQKVGLSTDGFATLAACKTLPSVPW